MRPSFFRRYSPYLQVAPLTLVFLVFLVGPLIVILTFSVFEFDGYYWKPGFVFENYRRIFTSKVVLNRYAETARIVAITWVLTFVIGFTIAYFFVFDLKSFRFKILFFLLAVVPFWTSGVVRLLSWFPILGRKGLVNNAVVGLGLSDKPLDFLFFSEFAVVVSYTHVFTLFMMAPLFNVMARIDPTLLEAARDQGAKGWQILLYVIIPLSKPGIAIGTIFVVALVASDVTMARLLSGGRMSSVSALVVSQYSHIQYPFATASGIVLLVTLLLFVAGVMRFVDVRAQL